MYNLIESIVASQDFQFDFPKISFYLSNKIEIEYLSSNQRPPLLNLILIKYQFVVHKKMIFLYWEINLFMESFEFIYDIKSKNNFITSKTQSSIKYSQMI